MPTESTTSSTGKNTNQKLLLWKEEIEKWYVNHTKQTEKASKFAIKIDRSCQKASSCVLLQYSCTIGRIWRYISSP